MQRIYISIDSKSLFLNVYNDNKIGHTPTVSTPIKQGKSIHKEVERIFQIPNQIDFLKDIELNDFLNKSSKSTTRVTNVFLFKNITVNGLKVNNDENFCMFVKEEIDTTKVQYGRTKLHYPMKISYDGLFSFNNKIVLENISKTLFDYAFVVKGFNYYFDDDILDFDVDIVGYNNIPYSKVFIANKGAGNKYVQNFSNIFDNYDTEIIALKENFGYDNVSPDVYLNICNSMKKDSFSIISQFVQFPIVSISDVFPYSLFDFTYEENKTKKYGIISFSATKKVFFNFTSEQLNFIYKFRKYVSFYMINNYFKETLVKEYSFEEIEDMQTNVTSLIKMK